MIKSVFDEPITLATLDFLTKECGVNVKIYGQREVWIVVMELKSAAGYGVHEHEGKAPTIEDAFRQCLAKIREVAKQNLAAANEQSRASSKLHDFIDAHGEKT